MLKYWLSESFGLFIFIIVGDCVEGSLTRFGVYVLIGRWRVLFCIYCIIAF